MKRCSLGLHKYHRFEDGQLIERGCPLCDKVQLYYFGKWHTLKGESYKVNFAQFQKMQAFKADVAQMAKEDRERHLEYIKNKVASLST
jgi:hypothetical protein